MVKKKRKDLIYSCNDLIILFEFCLNCKKAPQNSVLSQVQQQNCLTEASQKSVLTEFSLNSL